jgi:hypothetical protein
MATVLTKPVVYVEIVGAEKILDSAKGGTQFAFGDNEYWAPKQYVKIVDSKLYVPQWLATQNIDKWNGAWVMGTQHTKMVPDDIKLLDAVDEAIKILDRERYSLDKVRRALEERMMRRQDKADSE